MVRMEKWSQKRPRYRWLAWCLGPPAPRVTALACTACSSSPIRQTYTCGKSRSLSAEKYLYKKIFGNRMMRPTRTWSNAEQMRHNIVLTWPQPRIEPRKKQQPGEERGFQFSYIHVHLAEISLTGTQYPSCCDTTCTFMFSKTQS